MTRAIKCDACGGVVEEGALNYRLGHAARSRDHILTTDDVTIRWRHRELDGDLCGECAQEVVELLDEKLADDNE